MVVGIDVAHDTTAASVGRGSIAGFVASLNNGSVSSFDWRHEIILMAKFLT